MGVTITPSAAGNEMYFWAFVVLWVTLWIGLSVVGFMIAFAT